jgi:hypothetical protein
MSQPQHVARREHLQALPDELLLVVLTACATPATLLRLASTCWRLSRLCHRFDEPLWRPICLARFPRLRAVVAAARGAFSYRDLFFGERAAERAPEPEPAQALPAEQEVLEQFVVSMELHIDSKKLEHMKFTPEPTPSQETPGLVARWTGRIDELGEQRFWTPEAMPAWLQPEATCDTFSRVRLVVYLTWLHRAPRTLKLYDGEYTHGNDEGFGLCVQSLGCGPDECDGSTMSELQRPELRREAAMMATVVERDGHVELQYGYEICFDIDGDSYDLLMVQGTAQRARFMAMHFPCLPWPPLPRRVITSSAPPP